MPVSSCHDDCIPLLLGHFSYSVPPCRGFSMGGHRLRWLGHFVRCFRHYFHHCFRWFHHYQNYHWHLNRSRHCFAATLHVEKDFGEPSCQRLLHMIDHEWNHLLKKKIDMARSSRIIKPLSLARWPHPPSCYLFGQHRKFLGKVTPTSSSDTNSHYSQAQTSFGVLIVSGDTVVLSRIRFRWFIMINDTIFRIKVIFWYAEAIANSSLNTTRKPKGKHALYSHKSQSRRELD